MCTKNHPVSQLIARFWLLVLGLATHLATLGVAAPPTTVVTYPGPAGMTPAADFRVWVNDTELFLYNTEPAAVGQFSFSGEVTVRVQATKQDVRWADIRPKNSGITYQLSNNQLTFKLSKPGALSIEFHNESKRVVTLFANPPEGPAPNPADPHVKFFKAGTVYDAGAIELADGDHLYIEGGAYLKGSVRAKGAKNIRISGRGMIDGGQLPQNTRMVLLDHVDGASLEGIVLIDSRTWTVEPLFCQNLTIDNLKIVNWHTGSDGIDLVGTSHVTIKNCFVRANDDCIVIKTWAGDDLYPKRKEAGPDVDDITVTNSVFWNMPWGNALEIGFELRCKTIQNITFRNCDIIHVERGAAMSIHNGDFATVRNIRFDDIRIEDARHKLIDLAVFYSQYSVDRPTDNADRAKRYKNGVWDGVLWVYPGEEATYATHRGRIENIVFKDIRVVDGPVPFSVLAGFDGQHLVENVVIDRLVILGKKVTNAPMGKFSLEHTKGIKFR